MEQKENFEKERQIFIEAVRKLDREVNVTIVIFYWPEQVFLLYSGKCLKTKKHHFFMIIYQEIQHRNVSEVMYVHYVQTCNKYNWHGSWLKCIM